MKWLSADRVIPDNREEVLLDCNGKFLLANYDAAEKVFKNKKGSVYHFKEPGLRWCRLVSPSK